MYEKTAIREYLIDVADLITWGIHGKLSWKEWTQVSFSELI